MTKIFKRLIISFLLTKFQPHRSIPNLLPSMALSLDITIASAIFFEGHYFSIQIYEASANLP